jgi:hypothetical protein
LQGVHVDTEGKPIAKRRIGDAAAGFALPRLGEA